MKKIDPTVIKETLFITAFAIVFSVLMQSIFLVLNKWDDTVLYGNILGFITAVGNFFLMGLSVQTALGKEEKKAAAHMKLSQTLRLIMLLGSAVVGYLVPIFNPITTVVPFLFPRMAIFFRPLFNKVMGGE